MEETPAAVPEHAAAGDAAFTARHGTVLARLSANGVAHVRLNRPDSLNSLTGEVFADLVETGVRLKDDPGVRAVALTGRGRAFCAGLDMGEFAKMAAGDSRVVQNLEPLGAATALAQQAVHVWQLVPVPVVAGVNAVAFGGGLQIALAADLRMVQPDAKLSMMEVNWGLIPDMTGTQLLPGLVGTGNAKRLILTGEVFSGQEAHRLGLAQELADDACARAVQLAGELADKSRPALVHAKALIDMAGRVPLAEGFAREQDAIGELIGGDEQRAAVAKRQAELAAQRQRKQE